MENDKESATVRLSLAVSPELNELLEQLSANAHTTKSETLRKAIALFAIATEAKMEKKHIAILDNNKHLLEEIIGF